MQIQSREGAPLSRGETVLHGTTYGTVGAEIGYGEKVSQRLWSKKRFSDLPRVEEREAARSYHVSNREPWNKEPPIIISKDAAPIISFPMKNPSIGAVNTA